MKSPSRGYTLVEVVLVILILGIIVTIGLGLWSGVTKNFRDKARETEVRAWMASFENYKNRYYVYPNNPDYTVAAPGSDVYVCLGQFTSYNSKCGQYQSATSTSYVSATATATTTLLNEMKKIGGGPNNSSPAISNAVIGPIAYATVTGSNPYTVTTKLIGFFEGSCPSTDFVNINASLPTSISTVLSGLPSGTTVNACAIVKTFSYSPS